MRTTTPTQPPAHNADRRARQPRHISGLRSARGTALILAPTLLLVLLALAAITLDLTAWHGAHRSAHRVVSAAADDAAGMLDDRAIQRSGELRIDPDAATAVAVAHIEAAQLPGDRVGPVEVTVTDDGSAVTVTMRLLVEHLVLPTPPGADEGEVLTITATGRLVR